MSYAIDSNTYVIVTPCFNEGPTAISYLKKLEHVLGGLTERFLVVLVDDCSTDNTLELVKAFEFKVSNVQLHVLHLMYNTGHQTAIYQGLLYAQSIAAEHVIVMDSDGEDDPDAIPLLMEKKGYDIVEVKRGKRKESFSFRFSYSLYKMIFKFITGKKMDYGNYTMINNKIVNSVVNTSFYPFSGLSIKAKSYKNKHHIR